jgi:hypothetical protein
VIEQLAEEPSRGLGVTLRGDQDVHDIPVLVHRPPQIMPLAVDLDEHLVKVPLVPGAWLASARPVGVGLAKLLAPGPDAPWETITPRSTIISCTSRRLSGTGGTATRSG